MQVVLKRLQREYGITFIYVTHDQNEALGMSDRVAILADGVMHQVGTPKEIYFKPETPFVASFVGKSNLIDASGIGSGPQGSRVSVRPESIRLGEAAASMDYQVQGIVIESLFQGSYIEVEVKTEVGNLLAHVPTSMLYTAGAIVALGWREADMIQLGTPEVVGASR